MGLRQRRQGVIGASLTVKLERNYPDEKQKSGWSQTSQLRDRDLGDAIAVLQNIQQRLMAE